MRHLDEAAIRPDSTTNESDADAEPIESNAKQDQVDDAVDEKPPGSDAHSGEEKAFDDELIGEGDLTIMVDDGMMPMEEIIDAIGMEEDPCMP